MPRLAAAWISILSYPAALLQMNLTLVRSLARVRTELLDVKATLLPFWKMVDEFFVKKAYIL